MTEREDLPLAEGEEEEKKKKKGEGEAGAARGEVAVTPAFFEYMAQIGASSTLVAEVLRNWRHFKGEGLLRRVMDFAKGLVKSTHVQVEIDKGKDYAVVHNFIQSAKETPDHTLKAQQQHKHAPHLQTMDASLTLKPK